MARKYVVVDKRMGSLGILAQYYNRLKKKFGEKAFTETQAVGHFRIFTCGLASSSRFHSLVAGGFVKSAREEGKAEK